MARLPQPGGDAGNWGEILNDYLSQAHKSDGLIKDNAVTANTLAPNAVTSSALAPDSVTASQLADDSVTAATIADGSITEAQLDSATQTKLNSPTVADDSVARAKLTPAVRTELDSYLTQADVDARVTAVGNATYATPASVAAALSPRKVLFPAAAKLANSSKEKFVLAYYGDSLGEGVGANTFTGRFPAELQRLLTARYSPDVSVKEVYVPAARSANVPVNTGDFVKSGATGATGRGLRPQNVVLQPGGTPGSVTGTFIGTQFTLFFYRLVDSTVNITIDGGAPTAFAIAGGSRYRTWTSPVLASGSHTITVTASVAETTFCGMQRIDYPTDKGVQVWDLSVSGMAASHLANSDTWPGASLFADWIGVAFTPDLVLCHLLINDANAAYSSTKYKTDMQAIITKIRVNTAAPILLIPPWVPTNISDPWPEPRSVYVAKLRELAESNIAVAFRDLADAVPIHAATDISGFYNGSPHMNDRGQAFHARMVADALVMF